MAGKKRHSAYSICNVLFFRAFCVRSRRPKELQWQNVEKLLTKFTEERGKTHLCWLVTTADRRYISTFLLKVLTGYEIGFTIVTWQHQKSFYLLVGRFCLNSGRCDDCRDSASQKYTSDVFEDAQCDGIYNGNMDLRTEGRLATKRRVKHLNVHGSLATGGRSQEECFCYWGPCKFRNNSFFGRKKIRAVCI